MDGNKDEALKCMRIGKDALEGGDKSRALKFVLKARRLDPRLPVDELLARIEGDQVEPNGTPEADMCADQSTVGQRVGVSGVGVAASSSSKDYTEEQVMLVRQIRKKKDFYKILGVERGCNVEDVRKAYRKLSLKVHPDKNKAPGAEEAFKLVSKAFQCLSNEESKRKYDVSVPDEQVFMFKRTTRHNDARGFNRGDVDADEILRNFFFLGMGVIRHQQTQFRGFQFGTGMGHRDRTQTQFRGFQFGNGMGHRDRTPTNRSTSTGGSGFRTLIPLLPLIFVFLSLLPSNW